MRAHKHGAFNSRPLWERTAMHLLAKRMVRVHGDWTAKDKVSRKKKKRKKATLAE
jgi:hypothetical protein